MCGGQSSLAKAEQSAYGVWWRPWPGTEALWEVTRSRWKTSAINELQMVTEEPGPCVTVFQRRNTCAQGMCSIPGETGGANKRFIQLEAALPNPNHGCCTNNWSRVWNTKLKSRTPRAPNRDHDFIFLLLAKWPHSASLTAQHPSL